MTTVASGRCTSAPSPVLSAIGKKPSEATKAVISTGRSLILVPAITICVRSCNPSFFNLVNSATSTIPLSTATPNSAIKPMPAEILNGMPLIESARIPPMADSGMAE